MTALATPTQTATVLGAPTSSGACAPGAVALGNVVNAVALPPEPAQPKRVAHYLWAVLIASIYEVLPLLCPICGGQMRIIAFITHSADIRRILDHIGVEP